MTMQSKPLAASITAEQTHFDAISGSYYGIVDRLPFDLGYFHREELAVVVQHFSQATKLRILDAGCGPGRHTVELARLGHEVVAVDFSARMLAETQRAVESAGVAADVQTIEADVRLLPLEDASVDAIVCMEVLEHLPAGIRDVRQTLAELARVMKPGGTLIVEAPLQNYHDLVTSHDDFLASWSRIQPEEMDVYERVPLRTQNRYSPELIETILCECGFRVGGARYLRVTPAGLIERYPLLERYDRVLEQHAETSRQAREAIWVACRLPDGETCSIDSIGQPQVLPDARDPLFQSLLGLQRALTDEQSERRRLQTAITTQNEQLAELLKRESSAAIQSAHELQSLQQDLELEQQARGAAEKTSAGHEMDVQNLREQIATLSKELRISQHRRESLRAALSREQRARQLLEGAVSAGYQQALKDVSDVVASVTPRNATVMVVSKGDETLLKLKGRIGWHFPRAANGDYAGYHPADSARAIDHLESLRAQGGDYLALPSTTFWWLDHYQEFRQHLYTHYACVWNDERFVVFDLAGKSTRGNGRSRISNLLAGMARLVTPPRNRSLGRLTQRISRDCAEPSASTTAHQPLGGETYFPEPPFTNSDAVADSLQSVKSRDTAAGHAVIFAAVPYDDIGGGQRPAQLTRALLRRHWRVTYIYVYLRTDMTTSTVQESCVSIPRLDHRQINEITPEELLASIATDTPLIFEAPHPQFLPFAELAWKRGLPTTFELIDDWETSLGGGWFQRATMETFARRSTRCIGTARALAEKLRAIGAKEVHYVPNAADESVFDAYKKYARPRDLPTGYRRLLLYFGSLYGDWFGWDYVRAAAKRNPDCAFVLIGAPPRTHSLPSNVIFLGPKENHELPDYLAYADAAFIPFLPGPITDAVSPIKVFEYLFLKKPVIASRMPELDGYPAVQQAATREEFARLCGSVAEKSATPGGSPELIHQLDLFISRNSWNSRLDRLLAQKVPFKRFSFIILIHNNRAVIGRCLTTLIEHTRGIDSEIIVVDNLSSDGGAEFVEREFPQVKLLRNSKNGCSTGRNLGAAAATGEYLVFLDSDQWFTSAAWLFEADYILHHYPIVGAVGWAAGWFDPGLDSLAGPTVDCFARRGHNREVERCGFRTDITYLGSGGLFVPRTVWDQCSGFDSSYDPHAFEDTDFSFQIRKAGFRLAYRNLGGIRHQPHQTTRAADADKQYMQLFKRNSAYFKHKWADDLDVFCSSHPEA